MSERDAMADVASSPHHAGGESKPGRSRSTTVTKEFAILSKKIGVGCETALDAVDDDAVLRLEMDDDGPVDFADPVVLIGKTGAIEFSEGTRLMRALTGIDLGAESDDDPARWTWLQAALIGRLGATPFAGADRMTRRERPVTSDAVSMRLSVRTPHHAFSLLARGSVSSWIDILDRGTWRRDRRPASDYLRIQYQTKVRIARHRLPIDALRTVGSGDIFLPDGARFLTNGAGSIRLGGLTLGVVYAAPCKLKIITMEGDVEHDDMGVDAEQGDEDPSFGAREHRSHESEIDTTLDAIPVTLDFEMGQVVMSLGELRALGKGSVLEIEGGSPASIAIACNGRALGQGEVIDVNGQLGIRVTHWSAAS